MWKWKKDFFYFSKGDRIAIILLLNLIVISGGIFIYMNKLTFTDAVYQDQNEEMQKDFVQFENDMERIPAIEEERSDENRMHTPTKSPKTNKQKLELGQTIDINSASATTLMRIPTIGNTFAERIIEYRNSLGGFTSLEQLYEIKGFTINKFSKVLPYLVMQKKHKLIRINKIPEEQLISHPYFEEKQIQTIIDLRKVNKIKDISALSDNENFSSRDIERLSAYLSFD
ncbi:MULTISPECIES: helix-hairpin-helix domain-containing protein [unclassified Dysgonomonas]|uniref:helix-hairpin-helix domain-containing protein n=1 Tax=unclassified Dysgonomonas TaxID=2630389 RepID=UPI0006818A7D|nr:MULTISPECIES: helix-hairpin-helix domain-containing protein [unclassified Dysgonomonas]MBD8349149.1 helix-hairpin-helix domain-containing protein [Dysgonomonas sp. HGC4]MBF0576648.1 helix-hairpin-helix domain-containing protein [Dysgonomonas sp. GY617]